MDIVLNHKLGDVAGFYFGDHEFTLNSDPETAYKAYEALLNSSVGAVRLYESEHKKLENRIAQIQVFPGLAHKISHLFYNPHLSEIKTIENDQKTYMQKQTGYKAVINFLQSIEEKTDEKTDLLTMSTHIRANLNQAIDHCHDCVIASRVAATLIKDHYSYRKLEHVLRKNTPIICSD